MPPRVRQVVNGVIFFTGLVLCVVSLWRLQREHPLQWSASPPAILFFVGIAIAVLATMAYAWQRYVIAFFGVRLPLRHAGFQTCMMMVAKYVPILIAGFVTRVSAYAPYGSAKRIVFATLTELTSAMAAAVVVGLACFALVFEPIALPFVAGVALVAVWFAPPLIAWALRTLAALRRTSIAPAELSADPATRRSLREAPAAQLLQNILIAAFVAIAVSFVASDLDAAALVAIAGAYLLAIVAGIAVVFLPGGIGAREAAFVWLASMKLDAAEALQLALALRIAMSVLDLVAAIGCIVLRGDAESERPK